MIEEEFQRPDKEEFSAARAMTVPVATLILGCVGFYMFAKDWAYFEDGQMGLIACFLAGMVGVFYALTRRRAMLALVMLALCVGTIFASQKKYEWRKAYLEKRAAGEPFVLEPYISAYPPYEEYLLAPWLGTPDWVRFARDCIEPDDITVKACTSLSAIRQRYNIDVMAVLNAYRAKMARTAQKVVDGKITKKIDYTNCLSSKQCAEIPLLPPEVSADQINTESDDYIQIRKPFWQLVNDKTITPEICAWIGLCRALGKTGAINPGQVQDPKQSSPAPTQALDK